MISCSRIVSLHRFCFLLLVTARRIRPPVTKTWETMIVSFLLNKTRTLGIQVLLVRFQNIQTSQPADARCSGVSLTTAERNARGLLIQTSEIMQVPELGLGLPQQCISSHADSRSFFVRSQWQCQPTDPSTPTTCSHWGRLQF